MPAAPGLGKARGWRRAEVLVSMARRGACGRRWTERAGGWRTRNSASPLWGSPRPGPLAPSGQVVRGGTRPGSQAPAAEALTGPTANLKARLALFAICCFRRTRTLVGLRSLLAPLLRGPEPRGNGPAAEKPRLDAFLKELTAKDCRYLMPVEGGLYWMNRKQRNEAYDFNSAHATHRGLWAGYLTPPRPNRNPSPALALVVVSELHRPALLLRDVYTVVPRPTRLLRVRLPSRVEHPLPDEGGLGTRSPRSKACGPRRSHGDGRRRTAPYPTQLRLPAGGEFSYHLEADDTLSLTGSRDC